MCFYLVFSKIFCNFAVYLEVHSECGRRLSKVQKYLTLHSTCTTFVGYKRITNSGKRPPDVVGRKVAFNVKRLFSGYVFKS